MKLPERPRKSLNRMEDTCLIKVPFCIENIKFYFTLKNQNYLLTNSIY